MEVRLIINDVDFSPYIASGGIKEGEILRVNRSVVTLDGTEYRTSVRKSRLSVSLVELRDNTRSRLLSALTSPATVYYNGGTGGESVRTFYISDFSSEAKTVRGGHTYWSGMAFTLEEK